MTGRRTDVETAPVAPVEAPSKAMARVCLGLILLVAARMVFHAAYVPAYEGPDEPFHLSRAAAFTELPFGEAWRAERVSGEIVSSVAQHPCACSLHRAFGCPLYGGGVSAELNILRFSESSRSADPVANYESHQPPLYYLAGSAVLAVAGLVPGADRGADNPVGRLFLLRLFSVALVLIAVVGPLRAIARTRGQVWLAAAVMALLIPGAAEALARCANDSAVFLWAACVLWAMERRASTSVFIGLALLGPLVKLTSIPVLALALVWLLRNRSWWHSVLALSVSLLFIPLQWLRGYLWGGTVELNAPAGGLGEEWTSVAVGLVRSAYTFGKTAFWLGEWSFFRAPLWLLGLAAVFAALFILGSRLRPRSSSWVPYAVALAVAGAAVTVWFVMHRIFWGEWGGVGGWYAWAWSPWLVVAIDEFVHVLPERRRLLFVLGASLLLAANVSWFLAAHRTYTNGLSGRESQPCERRER
jgi:hypothetical protein